VFTRARQAAILATLVGIVGAERIAAGERRCLSPTVDADTDVGSRWPDLPGRIRAALEARGDVDVCARIALSLGPAGIVVVVVLPDGRSASRAVSYPEDVVPTIEALVVLPRVEAGAPAGQPVRAAGPSDERARVVAPDRAPVVSTNAAVTSGAANESGRFRLEFSLATGARAGDGQVGVNLGALTLFDVSGWLVGFEAAASGYQAVGGGPGSSALAAAVVGGRRLWLHGLALDVTAGPAVAVRGIGSTVVSRTADGSAGGAAPPAIDDGPWPRLLGGARVTFRPRSPVRAFAGLDGELALGRGPADVPVGAPRLPAWTIGVVLGATVGTR
jgi:hypothetical protein